TISYSSRPTDSNSECSEPQSNSSLKQSASAVASRLNIGFANPETTQNPRSSNYFSSRVDEPHYPTLSKEGHKKKRTESVV
ncbi:Hypothetical protein FKW44_015980, partial [Caligus rogercresseyi]